MRDAAVDRLARLISEGSNNDDSSGKGFRSHRPLEIHIGLAEGWFSLFLVATVVYSTIWSVQAVGWVDHLNILTLTTALGLIGGVLAAKQQRLPRLPVHVVAVVFGLLLAYWQTAGAFYGGDLTALAHGMHSWFLTIQSGGTGDDDSIFLFFIVALGFILAYTSAWLVYRTRSPWLMIVANAVVLLINLSNVDAGYIIFLIVFLIAALLLLLRFNLYESVRRWRRQGLRYADDLGWDVMQAGALISIGILVFSWLLPSGYTQTQAAQLWTMNANPWVQLEDTWNRIISVSGGINPSNRGNFRETLVLGGNPNLNHDPVFTVQSDDQEQYLASLSYDSYDAADSTWVIGGATSSLPIKTNQPFPSTAMMTHTITQKVTVVNPPGEQYPFLFGATDIITASLPASLLISQTSGATIAWLSRNGALTAGTSYTLISAVSSADVGTLRTVPLPKDAPQQPPQADEPVSPNYYNPAILNTYLQLPKGLDPRIAALAQRITAHAPTMYDKVYDLAYYLQNNFSYSTNVTRPLNEEGVSWLLFHSNKRAYCNYFASAMAIMARTLGIPARVVAGYTNGQPDPKHHQRVIYGVDAHAWTQIYFAGYGWINFEPSPGFQQFSRPLPNQYSSTTSSGGNGNGSLNGPLPKFRHLSEPPNVGVGTAGDQSNAGLDLRQHIGMAFGSLVLLLLFACIVFGIWWMRLFRRYGLAIQLYGRVCLLASWAGIDLRPSQTPYEYMHELAQSTPKDAELLEQLGDIYVRDQWADPESMDHPRRSGEINELPGLWKRLQPHLFLYLLRHPYFLRWLPQRAGAFLRAGLQSRRTPRLPIEDMDEEEF